MLSVNEKLHVYSAAVYASKSFEVDDGRRLMMNWVFETSVGCSGQCSAGTAFTNASVSLLKCFCKPSQMHVQAFTNASVRLHCLFPNLAPFEGPFCPSSWDVCCLESDHNLLQKWCTRCQRLQLH